MKSFTSTLDAGGPILTDGGIETRIMFETSIRMDPDVQVAAMLADPQGREALRSIYAGYVDAAKKFDLPVIIGTPTFRASRNFTELAGMPESSVDEMNRDAVAFHREIRDASGHDRVFIAGVVGPSGDAYLPEEALPVAGAAGYHRPQAEALAGAGADFLFAPTFPSVDEAQGACRAMADTGLPHVISYVLGPDHRVLDGNSLAQAIDQIDSDPDARPLYHSLSCIHPVAAGQAVELLRRESQEGYHRLAEFKANGSPLRTDELIKLDHPETDSPELFAREIFALYDPEGLRVLGGCCGTGQDHMLALAELLTTRD